MPRPLPAVGDIVRVHLVGRVTRVDPTTGIDVQTMAGAAVHLASTVGDDDGFGWKSEPEPEPVYVAGDLVADADGAVFLRSEDTEYPGDRWTVVRVDGESPGQRVGEGRPARPLKRLVPEGQKAGPTFPPPIL